MTLDELNYWGPPPYPCTITDEGGRLPIGWWDGHKVREIGTTRCGQTYHLNGRDYEVTWDGSKPDPLGGHTKGRLLGCDRFDPPYQDSLKIFARMFRVAETDYDHNETEAGTGRNAARKKTGNRKARKQGRT